MLGASLTQPRLPVPKGVDSCILFPPPGLCQRHIYTGEEGLFACWATSAEMIVMHRNPRAKFVRPAFHHMLPDGPAGSDQLSKSRIRYMDFVNKQLESRGFSVLPGGMTYDWTLALLASWLDKLGPLLFDGHFFDRRGSGALIHCVVVFGAQDGWVYYRDPADDNKQVLRMSMGELVAKAYPKNKTPWALGTGRFDMTPVS